MAAWSVDITRLKQQDDRLRNIADRLQQCGNTVRSAGNLRGISISAKSTLQRNIWALSDELMEQSRCARGLENGLMAIAGFYEQAENKILGNAERLQSEYEGHGKDSGTGSIENLVTVKETWNILLKVLQSQSRKEDDESLNIGWLKSIFTFFDKFPKIKGFGVMAGICSYVEDFFNFCTGGQEGWSGAAAWCDLGKSSSKLWNALYGMFKKSDATGMLELRYGKISGGVGIVGSVLGFMGKMMDASASDSTSFWGKTADYMDAGGELFNVGGACYDFERMGEIANKGLYTPAHLWGTFGQTVTSSVAQTIKSIDKYAADGVWDLQDTGATGVELAVAGLEKLVSGLTFGIVSAHTFGTSAEDISAGLLSWAGDVGNALGNAIVNQSKKVSQYIASDEGLYNEYINAGPFNKMRITAYANIMSWFR